MSYSKKETVMTNRDEFDDDFARLRAGDWVSIILAGCVWLAVAVIVVMALAGCASSPVSKRETGNVATVPLERTPLDTPFERCMATVGKSFYYTSDRVTAANWCYAHDNGGITVPPTAHR
jgi:hypothetical protein